jgi:tRNA(Arg) A34 adenosine deaminase TadA
MTTFEEKVTRTIAQLQHEDCHTMATSLMEKRMVWLDRNLPEKSVYEQFTPRDVFNLLFFDKIELKPEELPVIKESENEIIWQSYNRCSLLEACHSIELDTRKVCRTVTEKATQAFVSRVNPQFRFHRSYEEIRPYAEYCREHIIRTDFEKYMRIAIREAHQSRAEGNKGYGAVVVFENQILGQAHDTAITANDPSLHAEVNAIRQAVKKKGDSDLCGAILFSTCEPCPMCASLAVWANLTTIVYGISIEETVRMGRSRIRVNTQHIIDNSPCLLEIIGDVLHDDCKLLYEY